MPTISSTLVGKVGALKIRSSNKKFLSQKGSKIDSFYLCERNTDKSCNGICCKMSIGDRS